MSIQRRWVEGKTIAKVEFTPIAECDKDSRPSYQRFDQIIFTDGSTLQFVAIETETISEVEAVYYKK